MIVDDRHDDQQLDVEVKPLVVARIHYFAPQKLGDSFEHIQALE